jgi:hypothetical protein
VVVARYQHHGHFRRGRRLTAFTLAPSRAVVPTTRVANRHSLVTILLLLLVLALASAVDSSSAAMPVAFRSSLLGTLAVLYALTSFASSSLRMIASMAASIRRGA